MLDLVLKKMVNTIHKFYKIQVNTIHFRANEYYKDKKKQKINTENYLKKKKNEKIWKKQISEYV